MKKFVKVFLGIFTLSFFFGCQPAKADSPTAQCDEIASLAETIMYSRQIGTPMRDMYKIADEMGEGNGTTFIKEMVKAAFDKPRFSTEGYQKRAVTDFGSEAFMACIKDQ